MSKKESYTVGADGKKYTSGFVVDEVKDCLVAAPIFNRVDEPEAVFGGYSRETLTAAFAKVSNKKNWKNQIRATIDERDFDVCDAATAYFTGGALEWMNQLKNGKVRVWSAGYYSHIGS